MASSLGQQQPAEQRGQQQHQYSLTRQGRRQPPGIRPRKPRMKSYGSSISEPDLGASGASKGEDDPAAADQFGEKVCVFSAMRIMPVQEFFVKK